MRRVEGFKIAVENGRDDSQGNLDSWISGEWDINIDWGFLLLVGVFLFCFIPCCRLFLQLCSALQV